MPSFSKLLISGSKRRCSLTIEKGRTTNCRCLSSHLSDDTTILKYKSSLSLSRKTNQNQATNSSIATSSPSAFKGLENILDHHYSKDTYSNPELFFRDPAYEEWIMKESLRCFDILTAAGTASASPSQHAVAPSTTTNTFPPLQPQQQAEQKTLIDLGCGNGRFTSRMIDMMTQQGMCFSPCH